jgi:hypothetical protein
MSPVTKAAATASLVAAITVSAAMGILSLADALSHRYLVISIIAILLCVAAGWAAAPTGATRDGVLAGAVVGAVSSALHLTVSLVDRPDAVGRDGLALVVGGLALWAVGGALLGALGVAWRRRRLPPSHSGAPPSPLYTVFAVILLLLSTAIAGLNAVSKYGTQSGEAVGAAMVPLILLGVVLGIASLVRRGERTWQSTGRVSFWTMVGVFFVTCAPEFNRVVARDQARRGLHVDSTTIRHDALGFALPHPGAGFRVDSAEGAAMERRLTGKMLVWVFVHDSVPAVLVLTVVDSVERGEHKFREFATGVVNGARKRGGTGTVDTVAWQDSIGEARMTLVAPEGYSGQMRCITSAVTGRFMRLVCAQTLSVEGDSLGFVRTGLRREKASG